MRAVTSKAKLLTFEEWQKLPETKQKCEVVDGVIYMPPSPDSDHQWVQQETFVRCYEFSRASRLGVFLHAPLDLVIQRSPLRVRQPDIMFLNSERTGITNRSDLKGRSPLEVSPDIVVEILSPSNTRSEMDARLEDYRQIGVYQCWLVSPEAETVEVIDLTGNEPRSLAIFGSEDTLTSDLLPGFELSLREVFS